MIKTLFWDAKLNNKTKHPRKNRPPASLYKPVEQVTQSDLAEVVLYGENGVIGIERVGKKFQLQLFGSKVVTVDAGTELKVYL